jgi:hypothetical protein
MSASGATVRLRGRQGVIPVTRGFKLNDALQLTLFRAKVESTFSSGHDWRMSRGSESAIALDRTNVKIASIRDSH